MTKMKILKMVMAGGLGFMVVSAIGVYICAPVIPFANGSCIYATMAILDTFTKAGFVPLEVGIGTGGALVFLLYIKSRLN